MTGIWVPEPMWLGSAQHPRFVTTIPKFATRAVIDVTCCLALSEKLQTIYVAAPNPVRPIGSDRGRMPLASKIAAPTAGAIAMIGVSPAPIDG